jgi:unsaturated rhamnogalacturonyl hydrolase
MNILSFKNTILIVLLSIFVQFPLQAKVSKTPDQSKPVASMAQRFANSEMKRFPEAWQLDHGKRLYFGYSQGLGATAMLQLWKKTGDKRYYTYIENWADTLINDSGEIHLYKPETFNIDYVNSGKMLFDVYRQTGNPKYKLAMDLLIKQLKSHPRTSEGGYWHKLIYPHQIWLDGIYMGSPFMAQYGKEFNEPAWIDEAIHQVTLCYKRTYDKKTGLLYHAWDESKTQQWANPLTGHSPNFWGRSIGWFFMATVDVLDFVPESHPRRAELIQILQHLTKTMTAYQSKSGMWFQVIDKAGAAGNYEEASVTSMCMYAIAKSVNKGYVSAKYKKTALKAYQGLVSKLIKTEPDGSLTLTKCCAVAGLGGNPYRDGSYEYYINERIRDNDAKATGPFILGCIELNK